MEAVAVYLIAPLELYTGTDDQDLYNELTGFNGNQNAYDARFMQHNLRQSQTAQMGAGIYATPNQQAAREYGNYTVRIRVTPGNKGAKFLNLSDIRVTAMLREKGVRPDEWAAANPRAVVRFNVDYHVVKTCKVDFQPL